MPRVMLGIDWENGDGLDMVDVGRPLEEIQAEINERFRDKLDDPSGVQTHLFLEQVNRKCIKSHVKEVAFSNYREQFDNPRVLADLQIITHNISPGEQVVLKCLEVSDADFLKWESGEDDSDCEEEPEEGETVDGARAEAARDA